jgi:hypothetical protein
MEYVNPFSTLGLHENIMNIDAKVIRRLKNEYLVEFELQESITIELNGKEFDKNRLLKTFDQLQHPEFAQNHFQVFKQKELLEFLEDGKLTLFQEKTMFDLEQSSVEFKKFIAPYFSERYSKLLYKAFKNDKDVTIRLLTKMDLPMPLEFESSCYQRTYRYLHGMLTEKVLLIKEDSLRFKPLDEIIQPNMATQLNCLPDYFLNLRIYAADTILSLSLILNNEHKRNETAKKVLRIGMEMITNSEVAYRLQYLMDQYNGYPEEYWGKGSPDDIPYKNKTITKAGNYALYICLILFIYICILYFRE